MMFLSIYKTQLNPNPKTISIYKTLLPSEAKTLSIYIFWAQNTTNHINL